MGEPWNCDTCHAPASEVPERFRVFGSCYRCATERSLAQRNGKISNLKIEAETAWKQCEQFRSDLTRLTAEVERLKAERDAWIKHARELEERHPHD